MYIWRLQAPINYLKIKDCRQRTLNNSEKMAARVQGWLKKGKTG